MLSRYHWLSVRVRLRGERRLSLRIPPVSVHTIRGAILSCDGLLSLIRGKAGVYARAGAEAAQKALAVLQDEGLDVNVNAQSRDNDVFVRVHMI